MLPELRETSYKYLENTKLQPVLCIFCKQWYDKRDSLRWEGAKFLSPVAGIFIMHGNINLTCNEYSKQLSNEAKLLIHQITSRKEEDIRKLILTRRVHTLWETDFGGHWRVNF